MNPSDHFLRTINKDFDNVSTSPPFNQRTLIIYSISEIFLVNSIPNHALHQLIPQDIEEGLGGKKTTTAENIDALVVSYKSSVYMDKVTRQIADIRGTVSSPAGLHVHFETFNWSAEFC